MIYWCPGSDIIGLVYEYTFSSGCPEFCEPCRSSLVTGRTRRFQFCFVTSLVIFIYMFLNKMIYLGVLVSHRSRK